MSKIVEISSYFPSKNSFKNSVSDVKCDEHKILVDYLKQFAYKHSLDGLYKTYLFLTSDDKSAAYISFSLTTIEGNDAKNYFDVPLGLNYPIPALKITRLLTSDQYTRKGIATRLLFFTDLLGFILSSQIGCKAIVVDAKDDAVDFYRFNGYDILNQEDDSIDTLFMIKKIETTHEYNKNLNIILEEFMEFCNDYSLNIYSSFIKSLQKKVCLL
ncbi:GNAT family N-acetyltransferase [Sulfurimonas sp. SWIR-19]|uniref:GNAT family N-acetyltransferase n=1 Tax=Sulfurimonas sp. SWIR-19 TaxID=2878390 RepID=UPI001CF42C4D|nr:GNAT family N-acetyltransferase [Sulfurimonas sp. SWIR-19]UCN01359.1 GNAT family N-acetyltransferase [Sulfurimonas sp. SWIR-19]